MTKRPLPKAEDIYRHFKGGLYQIITIASHSETGEDLVIYRALYGSFKSFARPLSLFLSEVDREKYPDKEGYRFTKVEFVEPLKKDVSSDKEETHSTPPSKEQKRAPSPESGEKKKIKLPSPKEEEDKAMSLFMEFLDETSFDKKRNLLRAIAPIATDHIINSIAASLDLVPSGLSREADLKMINEYISARIHFDGGSR